MSHSLLSLLTTGSMLFPPCCSFKMADLANSATERMNNKRPKLHIRPVTVTHNYKLSERRRVKMETFIFIPLSLFTSKEKHLRLESHKHFCKIKSG